MRFTALLALVGSVARGSADVLHLTVSLGHRWYRRCGGLIGCRWWRVRSGWIWRPPRRLTTNGVPEEQRCQRSRESTLAILHKMSKINSRNEVYRLSTDENVSTRYFRFLPRRTDDATRKFLTTAAFPDAGTPRGAHRTRVSVGVDSCQVPTVRADDRGAARDAPGRGIRHPFKGADEAERSRW